MFMLLRHFIWLDRRRLLPRKDLMPESFAAASQITSNFKFAHSGLGLDLQPRVSVSGMHRWTFPAGHVRFWTPWPPLWHHPAGRVCQYVGGEVGCGTVFNRSSHDLSLLRRGQ